MLTERRTLSDRITIDPSIMAGKPVVTGTRIPVERVIAHLARVPDLADLFAAYPELTRDDVRACLDYAHTILTQSQNRSAGRSKIPRRPS